MLHWSRGRRARVVPAHARRRRRDSRGHGARPLRLARDADHLVDAVVELVVGDDAHLRYLSVQEHGPRTWQIALAARARRARRDARARRRSRSAATTRGCAASRCSTGEGGRERPARGVLRRRHADARLPHAPGPRRARARAATCCSRARSRTTPARSTPGSIRLRQDGAEGRTRPDQPQPRAHRGRGRGVDPEPRDRGQRRAVLARVDGRPDRRRPALLPREPRRPARRRRAADRARVLRRRARAAAGRARSSRGAAALGGREDRAPPGAHG